MIVFSARRSRRAILGSLIAGLLAVGGGAIGAAGAKEPSGQVVMAWHVTIAPSWFDPSAAPPQITPFGMLYAKLAGKKAATGVHGGRRKLG
jgi:hypothetical protein